MNILPLPPSSSNTQAALSGVFSDSIRHQEASGDVRNDHTVEPGASTFGRIGAKRKQAAPMEGVSQMSPRDMQIAGARKVAALCAGRIGLPHRQAAALDRAATLMRFKRDGRVTIFFAPSAFRGQASAKTLQRLQRQLVDAGILSDTGRRAAKGCVVYQIDLLRLGEAAEIGSADLSSMDARIIPVELDDYRDPADPMEPFLKGGNQTTKWRSRLYRFVVGKDGQPFTIDQALRTCLQSWRQSRQLGLLGELGYVHPHDLVWDHLRTMANAPADLDDEIRNYVPEGIEDDLRKLRQRVKNELRWLAGHRRGKGLVKELALISQMDGNQGRGRMARYRIVSAAERISNGLQTVCTPRSNDRPISVNHQGGQDSSNDIGQFEAAGEADFELTPLEAYAADPSQNMATEIYPAETQTVTASIEGEGQGLPDKVIPNAGGIAPRTTALRLVCRSVNSEL